MTVGVANAALVLLQRPNHNHSVTIVQNGADSTPFEPNHISNSCFASAPTSPISKTHPGYPVFQDSVDPYGGGDATMLYQPARRSRSRGRMGKSR